MFPDPENVVRIGKNRSCDIRYFTKLLRTLLVHKENKITLFNISSPPNHIFRHYRRVPQRSSARKEGRRHMHVLRQHAHAFFNMLSMQVIISLLLLYLIQNPFKEQLNHPSLLILKWWKMSNSDLNPWRKEVVSTQKRVFKDTVIVSFLLTHLCHRLLYKRNIKLVARRYVCISARWDCLNLNHSRADKSTDISHCDISHYRTSRVILLIYNGTIVSPQSFGVILRCRVIFKHYLSCDAFEKQSPVHSSISFCGPQKKTTCSGFIPLIIKCHRNLFRLLLAPHFCTPHRVKSVCLRSWLADELMFPQCSDSDLVALGNSGGNLIPRLRFLNRIWCCLIPTEG